MARRPEEDHEFAGSDSFLDVITNTVGILIILVIVVGQRAQMAPPPQVVVPGMEQMEAAAAEVQALERDAQAIAAQTAAVRQELAARSASRDSVNTVIGAVEEELAKRRRALDDASRQDYDLKRDLALAQDALQKTRTEFDQVQRGEQETSVKVESYPTPISRTVDSKEIHFQLLDGRLAEVPFDALVDRLKSSLRDLAYKLRDQSEVSDTIGPIEGFRMRYFVERQDSPAGSMISVTYIEFVPTSNKLGQPLEEALKPDSDFRRKLTMMSPRQYTITVWTYPDSFADFRKLKQELFSLGYPVAARPLPQGILIGASPQGSKSAAQ